MDTFAAVKKILLPILILFCYLLALLNAGDLSFQKTISSPSLCAEELSFSNYSSGIPETDHELISLQHFVARTGNSRFPSLIGELSLELISNRDHYSNRNQRIDVEESHSAKKYLSHIYPSHNFW